MAGREKIGRQKDKLQTERLGFFASEILGRADTAYTLRKLRSCARAGKRFAGEIAEGEILRADGYWRIAFGENGEVGQCQMPEVWRQRQKGNQHNASMGGIILVLPRIHNARNF